MTDRELMQQASEIEMLAKRFNEGWHEGIKIDALDIELLLDVAAALRERLAQPEQEPIAWVYQEGLEALKSGRPWTAYGSNGDGRIPLYLASRQWQGLTGEEVAELTLEHVGYPVRLTGAIEAKLRERNT